MGTVAEVEYELRVEDSDAMAEYIGRTSTEWQRTERYNQWTSTGVLLFLAAYFAVLGLYGGLIIALVLAGIAYFSMPIYISRLRRRRCRRMFADPKNQFHLGLKRISLEPQGMRIEAGDAESRLRYSLITDISSTPEFLFAKVGSDQTLVIPRNRIRRGDIAVFEQRLREFSGIV